MSFFFLINPTLLILPKKKNTHEFNFQLKLNFMMIFELSPMNTVRLHYFCILLRVSFSAGIFVNATYFWFFRYILYEKPSSILMLTVSFFFLILLVSKHAVGFVFMLLSHRQTQKILFSIRSFFPFHSPLMIGCVSILYFTVERHYQSMDFIQGPPLFQFFLFTFSTIRVFVFLPCLFYYLLAKSQSLKLYLNSLLVLNSTQQLQFARIPRIAGEVLSAAGEQLASRLPMDPAKGTLAVLGTVVVTGGVVIYEKGKENETTAKETVQHLAVTKEESLKKATDFLSKAESLSAKNPQLAKEMKSMSKDHMEKWQEITKTQNAIQESIKNNTTMGRGLKDIVSSTSKPTGVITEEGVNTSADLICVQNEASILLLEQQEERTRVTLQLLGFHPSTVLEKSFGLIFNW